MKKICGHELSVLKYALNRATSAHNWPELTTPELRIEFLKTCLLTITENQGGALAIVGRDRSTASHIVAGARLNAWQELHDPAKLAGIISETLRTLGVDAVFRLRSECGTYARTRHTVIVWDKAETTPDAILLDYDGHFVWRIIRMPQARALLLRLLQLSENATATDALREVEAA